MEYVNKLTKLEVIELLLGCLEGFPLNHKSPLAKDMKAYQTFRSLLYNDTLADINNDEPAYLDCYEGSQGLLKPTVWESFITSLGLSSPFTAEYIDNPDTLLFLVSYLYSGEK